MGNSLKWPDGDYRIEEVKNSLDQSFSTEKELCDYIELNIDLFTKDCLGYEFASYQREYPLYVTRKRLKGNRRIDFLIITKCGKRIGIECKKPKYDCEHASAIGQILSYIALFDQSDIKLDRMVLVSTRVDFVIPLIINKFSLPIEYICMDRKKHLTLVKP